MLNIIYPYRQRDLQRIKRSLDSLQSQINSNFKVNFVDYGSTIEHAKKVETLLDNYNFTTYTYHYTKHQPWNKSRALNNIIKTLDNGYCFVADVDMIFRNDFVALAIQLQQPETAVYFKVGFLDKAETQKEENFNGYNISFESTAEATGLTMFPVKPLQQIRGFDEFYHFWGSEDTDVHVRLKNAGYRVQFYEDDILMLHQWHQTYRLKETNAISKELQLSNIVRFNYQHLQTAIKEKKTTINENNWGQVMSKKQETFCLESLKQIKIIRCVKEVIDHFVFVDLPNLKNGTYAFKFIEDHTNKTLKYKTKKVLNKRVDTFYSLKEVNDILLLHIISFYRNSPYVFKISEDKSYIEFSIQIV